MKSLTERVAAGMEYLNKKTRSKAWMKKLDLNKLNLNDCHLCVIGQLTGDYFEYKLFPKNLQYRSQFAIDLGFMPVDGDEEEDEEGYIGGLTREWRRQIEAALAA